jgi:hypothetical protein
MMNAQGRNPRLWVISDRDGNIRAAFIPGQTEGDGAPREASISSADGLELHEVDLPSELEGLLDRLSRGESDVYTFNQFIVRRKGREATIERRE